MLCPGINDGEELEKTLKDLGSLPNVVSIAVVPLGTTKYRKEPVLTKVTAETSQKTIEQIDEFNKKLNKTLAAASDEFFILAGQSIKSAKYYGEYCQLDDGVGPLRTLEDDFKKHKKLLPKKISKKVKLNFATGQIAQATLQKIIDELNKIENLEARLDVIKSEFWGSDITVTGLITGQDLLNHFLSLEDKAENIIIPSVMLKAQSDEFLDGTRVDEIFQKLNAVPYIIQNNYSSKEIIDIINSFV